VSRLEEYLAYHAVSAQTGDIDPAHAMLRYVCDRFELNVEQRYWLAFLYAMTYSGASVFYAYNEFPDFENVNTGRLERWWTARGRQEIICQTDRRWVRSMNLFVPAVTSYTKWVGDRTQHQHFSRLATADTPEARYNTIYKAAKGLHSFGQFALFLYLEALHTITPLDLCPTNLDLRQAHSCRSGLLYAYGLDQWILPEDAPPPSEAWPVVDEKWADVRSALRRDAHFLEHDVPNVWNIETTLCAYKKYHRGKRYLGYYVDRQALEIAKMAEHVKSGVCWDVLWDFRQETYTSEQLVENTANPVKLAKGLPERWKVERAKFTADTLELARLRTQ
jgi:hypothetical protein